MQSKIREWQYVCDYEDEHEKLQEIELRSLSAVWEEQRDLLSDQEALGRFTEKLKREWAIETGLIERLYEFDRGITEVLIERGFDSAFLPHGRIEMPEKVISIIRDQKEAIESVFDYVKQERALSTSYVKEIHALLTRNQEFSEGQDQFGNRIESPLNRGDGVTG